MPRVNDIDCNSQFVGNEDENYVKITFDTRFTCSVLGMCFASDLKERS